MSLWCPKGYLQKPLGIQSVPELLRLLKPWIPACARKGQAVVVEPLKRQQPRSAGMTGFFRGCLALTIASGGAVAAEWSAEPSVSLRQEYNDNITLTALPHKAVWGTMLSPSVTFSGKSEVFEVTGAAQFSFNRYSGAKSLDSDDRILALSTEYKNERNTWGLNVSSKLNSTQASEQASTGTILPRAQRNALVIVPSWTHSLTERLTLHMDYTLHNVTYEDGAKVGLVDSKYKGAVVSIGYLLTDTDKLTLSGARSLSTSSGSSESKTSEIRAGLTHTFSETLQGDVQVGKRLTTTKYLTDIYSCQDTYGYPKKVGLVYYCGVDAFGGFAVFGYAQLVDPRTRTWGTSLNLGLAKKFGEIDLLTARLSRDISPSGRGLLIETDHLSLGYSKRFSENLSGSINTDLYRSRYPAIADTGSQYFTIAPSLSWQLSEWWYLDSGVQYARQKYDSSPTSVTSNLIYGSIRYNWPKMAVSR